MVFWTECSRLPWRCAGLRLPSDMVIPVVLQPILVLIISHYSQDSILVVSLEIAFILLSLAAFTKLYSKSQLFHYWIASSITYVIIVFENIVVPLLEIESQENWILFFFICLALFFLYLTKTISESNSRLVDLPDSHNGVVNSNALTEACPVCRVKTNPRSYHCQICQMCIAKYDYHCYWLNSCIGENNQHFFVVGVLFSKLALAYASLLILTTVCQPEFTYGILLPKDCTDVSATIGMSTCFISGIYCMELALILLVQLTHQVWLISWGYSALEWREQCKYSICSSSPYSRGFIGNWIHFFKSLKKISF